MVFYALKRSYIFIKEILELLFGKKGINHLEKHRAFFLVQLLAISTSDSARSVLNDEVCERIIDQKMVPNFKGGNYFNGIKKGVDSLIAEWSK
ncbi:TPM domain-containing protein [Poritiphilus flavus]|uniref:TPM domain-containing protein n=1 Tax=Poritiphilus flavus TaxID=2697053 RepID=A0A6L9EDX3_9FLAO|nr:TPM domain-containing protein [Poritiphilus flavus]NAS12896.1 hypothetical protein [Poritiphilus flavus]